MYASAVHWKALVNGYSGMTPRGHQMLGQTLSTFPSDEALEALVELGSLGVTHVVIHPRETPFPRAKWEEEWRWRIESGLELLPVARWPDALVYRINPYGDGLLGARQDASCSELGDLAPYPLQANFEGGIALLAYSMDHLEGQGTRLTLYWKGTRSPAEDYTVFVHALDHQGKIVVQADGPPVEGRLPTSSWPRDRVIRDEHIFPQGIEAQFRNIAVGLYLPRTMERLATVNERGEFAADHVILPWPPS
jgi:hypothetical protein